MARLIRPVATPMNPNPSHPLDVTGTFSILATDMNDLLVLQNDIRDYAHSQSLNDVNILSVLPIPSQYTGKVSGKINIDYTTKKVQTGTTYDDHTTGAFEANGDLPMSLTLSGIQFLLTYDSNPRS